MPDWHEKHQLQCQSYFVRFSKMESPAERKLRPFFPGSLSLAFDADKQVKTVQLFSA